MFLKADLGSLVQQLSSRSLEAAKESKALERALSKLESEASDAERGLKELIQSRV